MRVCWCSSYTGLTGQGDPLPVDLAVSWRDYSNQRFPDFLHWVEPIA